MSIGKRASCFNTIAGEHRDFEEVVLLLTSAFVKGFVVVFVLCMMVAFGGHGESEPVEHHFDFRDSTFDEGSWRLIGSDDAIVWKYVHREKSGLRTALPSGSEVNMVGFANRFAISGDFEITARYVVVSCETPLTGYGIGPGIYVKTLAATEDTAVLARLHRPEEGRVYSAYYSKIGPSGRRLHRPSFIETDNTGGSFRLVRSGETLRYCIASGDSHDFQKIRETAFGTEDLAIARFSVDTGGENAGIEVLWTEVTVSSHPVDRPWDVRFWGLGGIGVVVIVLTFFYDSNVGRQRLS